MNHKTFFILELISFSFIFSSDVVEIPFKMELGSFFPSFKVELGGSQYDFSLSLNIPVLLFHHNNSSSYDETGKVQQTDVSIYSYPLIEKTTGTLVKDTLHINKDLNDVFFISGNLLTKSEKDMGILGLAPQINTENFGLKVEYNSYEVLKNHFFTNFNIFSINNKQNLDGTYGGSIYLGYRHPDFQTKEGKTIICDNKNNYAWGCNFNSLSLNNKTMPFDSNEEIILSSDYSVALFNIKYLEKFKTILPEGVCNEITKDDDSKTFECTNWSINEMEILLNYDNNKLKVKIPDYNNIMGLPKLHYKFTPLINFSSKTSNVIIPLLWFKNYHILFSKQEKNTITFHTYDESLIEKNGEKKTEEDDSNYVKISTTAFVLLCIALGIVFVAVIMFIGYLRLSSDKPTRGLQSKAKTQKGQQRPAPRIATFDSALLGTSDDSMPKRLKTAIR